MSNANNIQMFNFENQEVRTLTKDDNSIWFVAKDVCDVLEISNSRQALARVDDDEKDVFLIDTLGGKQELSIINESGLYSLILGSRKAEAKAFKKWVTSEVLPSIRKTGSYSLQKQLPKTYAEALLEAGRLALDVEIKEALLLEAKPKVEFFDSVTQSEDTIDIGQLAKILNIDGIGRTKLFKVLREHQILDKNNMPYQSYVDKGYFKVVEGKFTMKDKIKIYLKTVVYQKGVNAVLKIFKSSEIKA
jgi:anti-repressor protein